jgi:hypothetical protein
MKFNISSIKKISFLKYLDLVPKNQSGYVKPITGSYVDGHFKTDVNKTNHDNFSTKENSNTNTGQSGSRAKDYSSGALNYGSGKTIQTG